MNDFISEYLNLLLEHLKYDIAIMSDSRMYYLLLIPALLYLTFFVAKWMFLTFPVWIIFALATGNMKKAFKGYFWFFSFMKQRIIFCLFFFCMFITICFTAILNILFPDTVGGILESLERLTTKLEKALDLPEK